jgi:murein DD-endopeptidase MepM/ murein hydrolase activator NlpD
MRIILLNRLGRAAFCVDFSERRSFIAGGLAAAALFSAAVMLGYALAATQQGTGEAAKIAALRAEISAQQETLSNLRASADEQINALALRLGDLNASVIRLNALGGRLTNMADLDDGEFDFTNPPAVGGPAEELDSVGTDGQLPQLLSDVDTLESTLEQQTLQLAALEGLMLNRKLDERVRPKGRPVKSGFISSFFGRRSDPMTGKSAMHKGIDFAGKTGSEVVAVGDGVVSWSGNRHGFGNMVEIKHGSGYVTRYAHNQVNLVAVGDRVSQGQTIALMGSTGRSTGSHLHFEVLQNGQILDPSRFVRGI